MFGWFKKRTMERMGTLFSQSQMTTSLGLMKYYGFDEAQSEAEKNERAARAAAGANYLFGTAPSPMHLQQFNIPEIEAEACEWLRNNPVFRELVVQSLRVATTINSEASRTVSIVGEKLLETFGREFPNAPDPTSYEQLVNEAICLLPPAYQQSILARMIKRPAMQVLQCNKCKNPFLLVFPERVGDKSWYTCKECGSQNSVVIERVSKDGAPIFRVVGTTNDIPTL
jgi:hypothetical protein